MSERTHELKVQTEFFDALESGEKSFEVRRDDRGFQRDDLLRLRDYDRRRSPWESGRYSGRETTRRITYVLTGGQFGIEPGFVVLALANIPEGAPRG